MRPAIALLALVLTACGTEAADVEQVGTSGSLDLEWAIFDGGELISCVDAGASELGLVAHALDRDGSENVRLSCYDGIAETGPLTAGAYDVELTLLSPSGAVVDRVELHDVSIDDGRTTPLGAIRFEAARR